LLFVFAIALLPDALSDWHTWSHIETYHTTSVSTVVPATGAVRSTDS
jgi:hypothetical protein